MIALLLVAVLVLVLLNAFFVAAEFALVRSRKAHLQDDAKKGRRGAATALGHFGHRAAEIHIDVVGQAFISNHLGRRVSGGGVNRVELKRAWRLLRGERRHVHGDRVALD